MNPLLITTGPNGETQHVDYVSPRTSGIVNWRLDAVRPDGQTGSVTYTIGVFVPYLVQLPLSGTGYTVANTMNHGRANWLTPDMRTRMERLPGHFARYVPEGSQIPDLTYTALNLEWGGLYDYPGQWRPPHGTHDDGRDVDIARVPRSLRQALGQAIAEACVSVRLGVTNERLRHCLSQPIRGERTFDDNATHYHVRGEN